MQIVVLGMHRSGTSVVTRLLTLMGAYFGPEGISTGANEENPTGFWERRDVRSLCDAALHGAGADWWHPDDWDAATVPDAVRDGARSAWRAVLSDLDAHRPWVVKEPRLCLVLPLLLPLLDAPVAVHVHRDPLEVAASLQVRNGFPVHVGLALWERYTTAALQASAGLTRAHVWYADLLADPERRLDQLRADLGVPGGPDGQGGPDGLGGQGGLGPVPPAELAALVSPALHRQRSQPSAHPQHLSLAQAALLDRLHRADEPDPPFPPVSPGALEVLATFAQAQGAADGPGGTAAQRLEAAEARLAVAQRRLDAVQDRYDRLRARRSVRLALAAAERARPVAGLLRRGTRTGG